MHYLILTVLILLSCFNGETINKMDENDKIKSFLDTISQIESSGGKNFNHPQMKSGIHAGQSAIGRYGLMPNTVSEVLNRMRLSGSLTPELEQLRNLDPVALKETLEASPELEDEIARSLANKVLSQQNDEEKAAYAWNQGHNLKPDRIAKQPYKESDYVKKYNTLKKMSQGDKS